MTPFLAGLYAAIGCRRAHRTHWDLGHVARRKQDGRRPRRAILYAQSWARQVSCSAT